MRSPYPQKAGNKKKRVKLEVGNRYAEKRNDTETCRKGTKMPTAVRVCLLVCTLLNTVTTVQWETKYRHQ